MNKKPSYNERLFSGGFLRSTFHLARFYWIRKIISEFSLPQERIIELGCYDGKLLEFLPKSPNIYKGFDANWEGGIDIGRKKYSNKSGFEFNYASNPEEMNLKVDEKFDLAVSMETFEHIPPEIVCDYLRKLSKHIDGYLLITVPNEKGLFFLLKRILKPKGELGDHYKFSFKDYVYLTLGKTNMVDRNDHKGFDYDDLIYGIKQFFDIIGVSGFSVGKFIQKSLTFGIGIIAKPKKNQII